jgi:hypothetical protein
MSTYEPLGVAAAVIAGALKLVYNAATGTYEYVKQAKEDRAAQDIQSGIDLNNTLANMNKNYQDATKPPVNPIIVPAVALGVAALLAFK